jgi:H+/Cl- antiporter ClcA
MVTSQTTIEDKQMSSKSNTYRLISNWNHLNLSLVFEGILVGFFSGLIVVLYRYVIEQIGCVSNFVFFNLTNNYLRLPLWLLTLTALSLSVYFLIKKEPMIKGSGIPQVEGILLRRLHMNWWRIIINKFCGGLLALGAGLSMGREGPSIQLGAAIGQGMGKILKRPNLETKYLITGGASAGLAAAFNAPLAGVIFALEEVHKNFSPLILLTAMSSALTADLVAKNFFGMRPALGFHHLTAIPLHHYLFLVILGIVVGVLGSVFNWTLLKTQDLYSALKVPNYVKMLIPFAVAGIIGIFFPQVLGGGHGLIISLTNNESLLRITIVLLTLKFVLTMVSYGSGAPGGIFLPMLAIGALIGSIYGNLIASVSNINPVFINNFIVLAMAGYFTAVVRSPITGCILISEMTGSLNHLLSLAIVSIIAFIVAELLGSKPIYESLLSRILRAKDQTNQFIGRQGKKVLLEVAITMGATPDGKQVKDLHWPAHSLLVGIKRGNDELIPKGDTLIYAGDYLIVLVNESHAAHTTKLLQKMAGRVADK